MLRSRPASGHAVRLRALGFVLGVPIFPDLTLIEVALLATMLAPTDAALGKAVVTNPDVPPSVREGLKVESGLNDGICVPILFAFLAIAVGKASSEESTIGLVLGLFVQEIGIGAVVGVVFAGVAGLTVGRLDWLRTWVGGSCDDPKACRNNDRTLINLS